MASFFKSFFEPIIKNNDFFASLIDLKDIKEKEYRKIEQERHAEKMSVLNDIQISL